MANGSPSGKTRYRWTPWLGCLLVLAVVVVFHPGWRFEFTNYDEATQLVDNPLVRSLRPVNVGRIFTRFSIWSYYPVRLLSFAVDYRLWGLNPAGYHVTNVLVHAANTLLVLWMLIRLTAAADHGRSSHGGRNPRGGIVAALAAGVFALHPVVVEPVAWIAGREELLMVFFTLICVHCYLSALQGESRRRWGLYLLSVLAAGCASMSNAVAAVVPFLLAALSLTALEGSLSARPIGKRLSAVGRWTGPFWIVSLATIALKRVGSQLAPSLRAFTEKPDLSVIERTATILRAYAFNLKTLFWPDALMPIYSPVSPDPVPDVLLVCGALLVAGTVWLLWVARKDPLVLFGLLWFLLALVPTSQLIPHHITNADRFLYLPLVGLVIAVSGGLRRLTSNGLRPVWVIAPGLAVLCAAGVRDWRQLPVWESSVTLWEHCLTTEPHNPKAAVNLAEALVERGELDLAVKRLDETVRINPGFPVVHYTLGLILNQQGEYRRAVEQWNKALELRPEYAEAHYDLGVTLNRLGRHELAVEHWTEAVRIDPDYETAHYNLGVTLNRLGEYDRSIEHFKRVVEINPKSDEGHYALGVVLDERGRSREAAKHLARAVEMNPGRHIARFALANVLVGLGEFDRAVDHYEKVLAADPRNKEAHNNLGSVLHKRGQSDRAVRHFRKALEIDPDYEDARENLRAILEQQE